ncbi:zinc finger MYM-type protein 1-like [Trifolium medium]|uniref:Zinc finger MYM-type protein 1-like n=1 Tax=Trifolium medium TaxID=97028 RepID=A0A392MT93_9FABA|nr:zinc finger MYM-type protein 1-like [Trifolium medium]
MWSSVIEVLSMVDEDGREPSQAAGLIEKMESFKFPFILKFDDVKARLATLTESGWDNLLFDVQDVCVAKGISMSNMDKEIPMDHRFSEGSNIVLDCFSCFDPKNSFSKFDVDKLARLADFYNANFSDDDRGTIREQLGTYVLQVKRHASVFTCEDVQSLAMKMVQTEKHLIFSLVYKLIELTLILPVSTASVERAFQE